MEKTTKIYFGLIGLTVLSIVAAIYFNLEIVLMILATLKFMGVSFYFMELAKAHIFWKILILVYLFFFLFLVLLFLN